LVGYLDGYSVVLSVGKSDENLVDNSVWKSVDKSVGLWAVRWASYLVANLEFHSAALLVGNSVEKLVTDWALPLASSLD
jgi:hypothetical protein